MLIFPAIDIIDGKPVRLFKGDFSTAHKVAGDAVEKSPLKSLTGLPSIISIAGKISILKNSFC